MKHPASLLGTVFVIATACAPLVAAEEVPRESTIIHGDSQDGCVDSNGLSGSLALPSLRVGSGGNDLRGHAAVFFFSLPKIPSRDSILDAELDLHYVGTAKGTGTNFLPPTFNLDLFGLDARPTATIASSDYHEGGSPSRTGSLIARGFITPSSVAGPIRTIGPVLRDFIVSLYHPDGTPRSAYAAFRANMDAPLPPLRTQYQGYELASADNTDKRGFAPQLRLGISHRPSAPVASEPPPVATEPKESTLLLTAVWILGILLAVCVLVILFLLHNRSRTSGRL